MLSSLLLGCQPGSHSQRRLAERTRGIDRTLQAYAKSEASRPAWFERDCRFVPDSIARDSAKLDRDLRGLDRNLQNEFRRLERRQADYRRTIIDLLDGRLGEIEKNAIDLFY